ncbi:Putative diacylglycerol O-acyltransferase [Mycobacterium simulans]|uniref:diacylglycerol O-acyltransferase n=1 Tax=Mycobacterium simulans TaxID=627089 RepID=A0A7Z7IHL8_9MYCO|nr:wax ester/triacylglycerol synthase domain-containing protein [Mycobacterium simulans]SOJ53629.1 Putative diacylglycerol O-acyltransferase [Mycobacterium simulans]
MAKLTTLDAGLLGANDPDRHASMAISAVAIVNGTAPHFDDFKSLLAERIKSIPRYAQVPRYDLAQHIQRVALPRPGDEGELFRAVAHALERPIDMDRPLWECWIIEGLNDNRWAILMKIHHSMANSISAAQLLTLLCDDVDTEAFANHPAVQHVPRSSVDASSWTDALLRTPATIFKAAAQAVTWPLAWIAPTSPATTRRRYRTVRIPRAAVDAVSRKFGVTANDVALAAITEGFRTVLLRRGEQPRADSLRTISAMLPYLPVEHDDPVTQLRTVHNRLNRNDQRQFGDLSAYMPFTLCAKVFQILTRLPQRGGVALATNTAGPRQRLRLMGQRMDQLLPIPPTALQLSTGVAVLSYGDELVFGLTADYNAALDLEQLAAGIELGMARLVAHSQDSVLLFSRDGRRRSARPAASGAQRRTFAPPAGARR